MNARSNDRSPLVSSHRKQNMLFEGMGMKGGAGTVKKLYNMMNDKDFFEYFYALRCGSYRYNKELKRSKYRYYAQFESSKHVYPIFKSLFSDFLKKLDELEGHIGPHCFTDEANRDLIIVMPYEHRKYWSEQEVEEFVDSFMKLVDIAESAYIRYRAAIRDTLYI